MSAESGFEPRPHSDAQSVAPASPADAPQFDAPSTAPSLGSVYEGLEPNPVPEPAPGPNIYDANYQPPGPSPVVATPQYGHLPATPAVPQQPGYGVVQQPGYGYQPAVNPYAPSYPYAFQRQVPDHPNSGAIFGLGIASLAVGVTAPIAWFMGARAKREIAKGAPYKFSGLATAGYVIGIIYTIFGFLGFGFIFLVMLLSARGY